MHQPIETQTIQFSKLKPGDYLVVKGAHTQRVGRFVGLDLSQQTARVGIVDQQGWTEFVPVTALAGQLTVEVDWKERWSFVLKRKWETLRAA